MGDLSDLLQSGAGLRASLSGYKTIFFSGIIRYFVSSVGTFDQRSLYSSTPKFGIRWV